MGMGEWGQTHKLHNNIKKMQCTIFPLQMESSICAKIKIVIIIIIINLGRQNGPFHAGLFCFVE
jgi:hypothetical protein